LIQAFKEATLSGRKLLYFRSFSSHRSKWFWNDRKKFKSFRSAYL